MSVPNENTIPMQRKRSFTITIQNAEKALAKEIQFKFPDKLNIEWIPGSAETKKKGEHFFLPSVY